MRGVVVEGDELVVTELSDLQPGPGEVRIAVTATAVNRADLMQRRGLYPPPPGASPLLGLECSGVIDAVGAGVPVDRLGEPVCALLAGGGYASQVVCPAAHALPIPEGIDPIEAAGIPEVFATAWLNVFHEAGTRPGQRVLVHAGGSGVGTAAVQLCRVMGCPVFVTAGSPAKIERAVALGADGGADRHEAWVDAVRAWGPVHCILDPVAGWLADDLRCLDVDGVVVVIGLLGGRHAELDLGRLLVKRLRVVGSTLRSRSDAAKTELLADMRSRVWPHFASGQLRPVVDRVLALDQVEAAHAALAANATVGKVLLVL